MPHQAVNRRKKMQTPFIWLPSPKSSAWKFFVSCWEDLPIYFRWQSTSESSQWWLRCGPSPLDWMSISRDCGRSISGDLQTEMADWCLRPASNCSHFGWRSFKEPWTKQLLLPNDETSAPLTEAPCPLGWAVSAYGLPSPRALWPLL